MTVGGAVAAQLADGRRLHLHHGPIDLIVEATGSGRVGALAAAQTRFDTILQELVEELALIRSPPDPGNPPRGPVAQVMFRAASAHLPALVTPMIAVAGAVADEIARVMHAAGGLETAYVNNGGDVALVLAPGQHLTAAIADGGQSRARIGAESAVRGIATSGWQGRSHSFGIADSVTVLARTAAEADAAATIIANAVDLPGHPGITRRPAIELAPDSDLGARPVTVGVSPLSQGEVNHALAAGVRHAEALEQRGLIEGALLSLQGARVVTGAAQAVLTCD